jgi:hypothetical protein
MNVISATPDFQQRATTFLARKSWYVLIFTTGLLPGFSTVTQGSDVLPDQVILRSKSGVGRITVRCLISNYTGRLITFRTTPDGPVQSFPAKNVISVQTPQSRDHVLGLVDFTRSQFGDAQTKFVKALTMERREWVRRELLALLTRCALMRGNFDSACSRFSLLVKSDPSTKHLKLLPLVWGSRELKAGVKASARQWITDDEPVSQLMGASILLFDATWSNSAETTLIKLTRRSARPLRDLARMQLWRKKLRTGSPNQHELKDWQSQINAMEHSMRGGPYFLLGQAHLKRRENEQAASAFLWLPVVYSDDHHLAAQACLLAADALLTVGKKSEAKTMYREVTVRFAKTTFAQEAVSQFQKHWPSKSSSKTLQR